MISDPALLFAVNRLPGHDGRLKRRVLDCCRDWADLPEALAFFRRLRSPGSRAEIPSAEKLRILGENDLKRSDSFGIKYHLLGNPDYPESLARIADPPLLLFYRGVLQPSDKSPIAVVGTRRPDLPATRQAYALGLEFSYADYPVVSGLAFGIDKAAHEGALAARGVTWAVLAGGLDRPGPRAHRQLASRILEQGGALIGEMVPGEFPARYAFPRRNRILSGLARGCIVVQAPAKSGALITADFALEQNRDVYVASAGMDGVASEGTRELEAQGAPVVESASDVLGDWGRFLDICRVTSLNAPGNGPEISRMMDMELQGRLHRYMGGWFEYRGA